MRLELGNILINDVQFGEKTKVEDHVLYVNKQEIIDLVMEDEHITNVDVELARPGESVRITPVKDVIEPRVKVDGPGGVFPGMINNVVQVGSGRTHVLKGAAVMTVGKVVGFQEGIVDMTGPGADFTPFSKLNNVVLNITRDEKLESHAHEKAIRMAGLKVAAYLGEAGREVEPDEVETFETKPIFEQAKEYPDLPKVVYVQMIQTQGLLHDTYVYGVDGKQIIPTILYPTESMDGAICSGNCVSACDKNTTYHHQNNPVVRALYGKHGKDINFMGVIVTNENVYLADKERSSNMTAKLAEFLGADGAVVSQEGFGNPDTDLIMNSKKLAAKGIAQVIITDEYAGRDGASQSLADSDPAADACVTGGNANEVIVLPKLDKVIGTLDYVDIIAGGAAGSLRDDGSIEVEIQAITGATNELGFNKMSATGY
ncbi:glycine/sarcosine/betaine reductase component B subunit [Citroniella saccharovorans]|uniref:Glycine/sarcosine/betaine reductase component B subunit n=1 Tax=Citroniella saccharovorans TaxID=2053367 RepID=A0AAW9MU62_9FIRM|nr:glycine/sarcosine/betaine reductase component B subunit [Citroniella saccharovorans]MEB3428473.1 glycine/sarcosine/betaine reductase component B subunit [Citroniella saccharovorans]